MTIENSLSDITERMKNTDTTRNNPVEWGFPASDATFDTLSAPITDRTLQSWALKLAQLLNHIHEQENDVDVFVAFQQDIHKALRQPTNDEDLGTNIVTGDRIQSLRSHGDTNTDAQLFSDDFNSVKEWASQVIAIDGNVNNHGVTENQDAAPVPVHTCNTAQFERARTADSSMHGVTDIVSPGDAAVNVNVDFNEWLVPEQPVAAYFQQRTTIPQTETGAAEVEGGVHKVEEEFDVAKVDAGLQEKLEDFGDDFDDDEMLMI
jgi:hypothetical protein